MNILKVISQPGTSAPHTIPIHGVLKQYSHDFTLSSLGSQTVVYRTTRSRNSLKHKPISISIYLCVYTDITNAIYIIVRKSYYCIYKFSWWGSQQLEIIYYKYAKKHYLCIKSQLINAIFLANIFLQVIKIVDVRRHTSVKNDYI